MKRLIVVFFSCLSAVSVMAQVDTCNAEFAFDVNSDSRTVKFVKSLMDEQNTSYHWDFGDGSVSSLNVPTHSYVDEGDYVVCLTITTTNGCVATFCDSVSVTMSPAQIYNLSGRVFTNYSYLPHGFALLAENQSDVKHFISVAPVIDGNYAFSNLNQGYYYVYIIPFFNVSQVYFPFYLPTYSGNSVRWQQAQQVPVFGPGVVHNIQLESFGDILNGTQTIKGQVLLGANASYENEILMQNWLTHTPFSTSEEVAANIPVLLYNEQYIPVKAALSDSIGEFSFENLPFGKYYISPEKAGFVSPLLPVNLIYSDDNENYYIFNLGNQMFTDIKNPTIVLGNTKVYPVPADDFINISSEDVLEYELYNSSGVKMNVYSQFNSSVTQINTSQLMPGLYLLKMTNENHQIITTVIIVE